MSTMDGFFRSKKRPFGASSSSVGQPASASLERRRACDGEHYTQEESHEHRQSAQDELADWYGPADATAIGAPRRRGAEQLVGTSSVAQDDILDISMVDRRGRSAEQPVASSNKPAQFASKVHSAVHAKHTEYMMFLQVVMNDFYHIWRSFGEPKSVRASWSSQWNYMTRMLEAIARDVAAYNCLHELDCSLRSVVQPASIEKITATSSLLFRKVSTACKREAELLILLDGLALVIVHKACWAEVKKFFESTSGDDAAFKNACVVEAARELNEGNLHLKNLTDEAKQLLDVPSWTAS